MIIKIKSNSLCSEDTGQKLINKALNLSFFLFIVDVF